MGLGGLLVFRRIVRDVRRRESLGQLFVAGFDLVSSRSNMAVSGQMSGPRSFIDFVLVGLEKRVIFCGAPLGNHQLAAALFFEKHGVVESGDGALRLFIRGRLSCDPLHP